MRFSVIPTWRVGIDPANPDHLLTIHGEGYRFEFAGAPPLKAPLTLPSWPLSARVTHRSRGNETNTTSRRSGRVCTRMIVSERFSPPM